MCFCYCVLCCCSSNPCRTGGVCRQCCSGDRCCIQDRCKRVNFNCPLCDRVTF